jgi:sugar phosphate permease
MTNSDGGEIRVYGYRWVVLLAFMFIAAMNQLCWISFAPITSAAAAFYRTSEMTIGLLSMVFMLVYIVVVIPAAWAIDTWGIRRAVGLGAVLTGLFALGRGIFARNLALVFVCQTGLALAQPLVAGAVTKLVAHWFPIKERATAAGLGTLAMYVGILAGMVATPFLFTGLGMPGMLSVVGAVAAAAAVAFVVLVRERPPTPPCPAGDEARVLVFDGLRRMLQQRDFILLLVVFFIGLGVFNGVSTWIEQIVRPRGFSSVQAGLTGGFMLIGGIVGAIVMPILSDRSRRRKPFILLSLSGMIPGLVGMTYATSYWLLLASGFVFGFFLLSSGPIGFQYAAEITHPAPEATSNSLLFVMGQLSGIAFIFAMDALKAPGSGSMAFPMLLLVAATLVSVLLGAFLRDSGARLAGSTR